MLDTKKIIIKYLISSILLIIINYIYSLYSHGVSSIYMTYMFLIPLLGLILSRLSKTKVYQNLLASSILTLVLASLLKGIVDIAGTSSSKIYLLIIISIILFILSIVNLIKIKNN